MKSCFNCKYIDVSLEEYPCASCYSDSDQDRPSWEPEEDSIDYERLYHEGNDASAATMRRANLCARETRLARRSRCCALSMQICE